VVYAKEPFAGPKQVLRYLSRYTHRIAISNRRLLSADQSGVTFKYKDYRIDGPARYKTMTLATNEFIRRFLIHVLPKGFHRIRHYGLLGLPTEPQTSRTRASCSPCRLAPKNARCPKQRSTNPACCNVHVRAAAAA
jgi:Putative transposase.